MNDIYTLYEDIQNEINIILSQQSNIFGHKPKLDGIVKNDFLIVLLNIISHNCNNNREVIKKQEQQY